MKMQVKKEKSIESPTESPGFIRRLTALILILMIASGTIACGNKTGEISPAEVYRADAYELGNIRLVGAAATKGNIIYFSGFTFPPGYQEGDDLSDEEVMQNLYYIDMDAKVPEAVPLFSDYELDGMVRCLAVNDDGSIDLVIFEYSEAHSDDEGWRYPDTTIQRISREGTELIKLDVTDALRGEEYIYPQALVTDTAGRFYLINNGTVYLWDQQGRFINKIPVGSNIAKISLDRAGEKVFVSWDKNWNGTQIAVLDPETGTLGASYHLEGINAYYGTAAGAFGDLLLVSENGVYVYDHQNRQHDKVFDWMNVNMSVDFNGFFLPLADGRIGWMENTDSDWNVAFRIVRPLREGEEPPAKETLVLGGISFYSLDNTVRNAVMAFNDYHPRFRIEIKEYGEGDYEAGIRQLNMDIVNGIGPDIVILPIRFSMDLYARKEVLADLYPFIDRDEEMARSDFYENILAAYESGGNLFGIPIWFDFRTIIAAKSEVGDIYGWNLDEMIHYVDGRFPASPVFENAGKSAVLSLCLYANGDALVDWTSAESGFQRDLFLKMLYFADRFTPDHLYQYEENYLRRIQDDDQLQLLSINVGGYGSHQMHTDLFGGSATYPGYPAENGNGNIIGSRAVMAISASCQDKEAAWAFLRTMLNEEFQSSGFTYGYGFPILKSAHEILIMEAMKATYIEENGVKKEEPKAAGMFGDYHFDIYAATEDDIKAIRNLLDSANMIRSHDGVIDNIALEEAQSFFSGAKTAEEAADVAENRIRIYVEEMK